MSLVTIEIDGTRFEVDKGKTVLEVAIENNIDIPTLCYHKALSPYGACRLCIVELVYDGWSKLATSCTLFVGKSAFLKSPSTLVVTTK